MESPSVAETLHSFIAARSLSPAPISA